MAPKVSIVCPTFNGATRGYLREAIESALDQTFKGYELIIVDDGSTDHTKEVCEPYLEDSRVHYIFQPNAGPASARNTGISASSGEFICFLDDDDLWKPRKLEKQIDFISARLSTENRWGMLFTWVELINAGGDIVSYRGHHQEGSIYRALLFEYTIGATSSVLVKREVFDTVGLFDGSLEPCEDWDLWLRISKEYLVFPIKEYLVQYREHQDRISADREKVFYYEKAVLKKNLASAPPDINPKEVYASYYIKGSLSYFASDQYQQFRKMFLKGVKISLKPVRVEHILLFVLSLFGRPSVHLSRSIKRYLQKQIILRSHVSLRLF
jgi:glycosyltransferase involved in cell wall biosynthesis